MTPATISEWIDQTRQLLEDDLIDCKAAAIDTVTHQLDCLERQLLREAVTAQARGQALSLSPETTTAAISDAAITTTPAGDPDSSTTAT